MKQPPLMLYPKSLVAAAGVFLIACAATSDTTRFHDNAERVVNTNPETQAGSRPLAQREVKRRLTNIHKLTSHLSQSHTRNLLRRPFSSLVSLVSVSLYTVTDLIRDTALDTFFFPRLKARSIPQLRKSTTMDLDEWERELDSITGRRAILGDIELLINGDEFFPRFTEAVEQAKTSVMVRTYIFDNDDYALEIADLLKRRSWEVSVRVLYDGIGTISGTMVDSSSMPRDYVPPSSIQSYLEENSNISVRKVNNPWLSGDHSKTIIIDEHTAFMGGMNIGREYRYDWHDMMFELRGEVVRQLKLDADKAWERSGKLGDFARFARNQSAAPTPGKRGGQLLRLLYTRPGKSEIYQTQLRAIGRAKQYIFIQNAYFSDDRLLYELAKARRRGVEVRVILPSRGDNGPMDKSNILAVNSMLNHGIRVFIYPGMSHVKAAIFDNWACFGSANFDKMSLRVNKEINVGTSDPTIVQALREQVFAVDFARSRELLTPLPVKWTDHLYERLADLAL